MAETTFKLVVNSIPVADILPKTAQYCGTTGASISATPNGNGETYEWFKDGLPFGTASSSNVLSNALAGTYTVHVISNGCKNVVSSASVVSQTNAIVPKVEISADKPTICAGETVTFTANPTNATSYEWFVNSLKQTSTTATFSSTSLSNNDTVKVILTTDEACANPKTAQDTILAKVQPVLVPSLKLKSTAYQICEGQEATFEIGLTANQGSSPTYAWFVNNAPFAAASTATSIVLPILVTTNVYAVLTSSETCVSSSTANSDTLTASTDDNVTPIIQITSTVFCESHKFVRFQITELNSFGTKDPTFQWLLNDNQVTGKISDTAFFSNLKNGDIVALEMTSSAKCKTQPSVKSNEMVTKIIPSPKAYITTPVKNGLDYYTNAASVNLAANADSVGTNLASWEITGSGTLVSTTGITSSLGGLSGQNITEVHLIVKDQVSNCGSDTAKIFIHHVEGLFAFAGSDTVFCSTETMKLAGQGSSAGAWTSKTNGATVSSDGIILQYIIGNNEFKYCVTDVQLGKTVCDSLSVTVVESQTATITIKVDKIGGLQCEGDTAYVSATSNVGTVTWSNGIIGNKATFVNWKNGDKISATLTNTLTCVNPKTLLSAELNLNGTARTAFDFALNLAPKADSVICRDASFTLAAITNVAKLSYTWSNGTSTDSTLEANTRTTVRGTVTANKTGCFVSGNTISKTADFQYNLAEAIDIDFMATSTSEICEKTNGSFFVETKTGLANVKAYQWYVNGQKRPDLMGTTVDIPDLIDGSIVKAIAIAATTCTVDMSDSTNLTVQVYQKPKHGLEHEKAGDILYFCKDDSTLRANETNSNYNYQWINEKTTVKDGSDNTLIVSAKGNYTLVIQNGACTDTSKAVVKDYQLSLEISVEPAAEFEVGEELKLTANVTSTEQSKLSELSYEWSPANMFRPANAAITTMSPTETMFVTVEVKSPENCTLTDSIQLKKRDKLFIPNALTPETGDQNAVWGITGAENYPDMDIKIFNRWGTLVHEQKGYTKQWDGTLNGKPLPAGTYYYVMKHLTLDKPRVGDLTIVR